MNLSFFWLDVQLGQVETTGTVVKNDIDTREQLIMSHYNSRINELTLQLQQADSKAVNFHAEVTILFVSVCKRVLFITVDLKEKHHEI